MRRDVDFHQVNHLDLPTFKQMTLKAQLKIHLERRGITAAELARKSGVSKQVISLWLNGAKPKNVDQVKKVADSLGTSIDNLLFGEGIDREAQKVTEIEALLGDGWVGGLFEVRFRRVKRS